MPTDSGSLLAAADFLHIVKNAPLIAIDLVIEHEGRFLLGLRSNRPAKSYWFVPGGRVRKAEDFPAAFSRLTDTEIGKSHSMEKATPVGLYQHFYEDCFAGEMSATHYIVVAMRLHLDTLPTHLPLNQHCNYRWQMPEEITAASDVHRHTKAYFQHEEGVEILRWLPR